MIFSNPPKNHWKNKVETSQQISTISVYSIINKDFLDSEQTRKRNIDSLTVIYRENAN